MQTESDARLLAELQRSLPLAERPFSHIGRTLNCSEDEVIETTARLLDSGVIRRLGAFFDARRLGYETTLVAADIGEADPDRVVAPIVSHLSTTHVYLRDGRPALWYTLHARGDEALRDSIQTLEKATGVSGMLDLRAERVFKLRVRDASASTRNRRPAADRRIRQPPGTALLRERDGRLGVPCRTCRSCRKGPRHELHGIALLHSPVISCLADESIRDVPCPDP